MYDYIDRAVEFACLTDAHACMFAGRVEWCWRGDWERGGGEVCIWAAEISCLR